MAHEHAHGPDGQSLRPFRSVGIAIGWALAGAAVSGGVRAGMLVGAPALGYFVSPLGTDEPLSTTMVAEVIGLCAGVGLLVGALSGSQLGRPYPGLAIVVWGFTGALTGAIGSGLTFVVIESNPWVLPAERGTVVAWAVAGLFAGFAGFVWNRLTGPEPAIFDEAEEADAAMPEAPRVLWVRGSPAGRLVAVFSMAMICFVASLVTPPSTTGWAVVAVGLLGLAVGCALVGQERRIASLEHRLRKLA